MDLLDRLLGHDVWTTARLLDTATALGDAALDAPVGGGVGSLRETFDHVIANMEVWGALMAGADPADRETDRTPAALHARLQAAARRLADVARASGAMETTFVDVLDDPPRTKSVGTGVAHLLTHSMHHRAQIIGMLKQLGAAEVPEGDVFSWENQAPAFALPAERVSITSDTPRHLDAVVALWTDPEVMQHMGGPRDPDVLRRSVLSQIATGPDRLDIYNVVRRTDGRFLGNVGLVAKEIEGTPEVELVYLLTPDAEGQGYATEAGARLLTHARETLGLEHIVALIHPAHVRSEAVAARLGFEAGRTLDRPAGPRVLWSLRLATALEAP